MLRLGQILTKNESERYGISLKQLARYMVRNRKLLHNQTLTAKQIRSNLYGKGCELRGGGVCAQWQTESECVGRKQAEYKFSFSRILRPEDYLMPTPEELDAQVAENQWRVECQLFTSLLRFRSGWFANHENRQRNQAVV